MRSHRTMSCRSERLILLLVILSAVTMLLQITPAVVGQQGEWYWARINYTFTRDFLINTGMISIPHEAHTQYSSLGYGLMRNTNVTILGVAKNVASQLPHVLGEIEHLSSLFEYSRAIIVEGDSIDESFNVLTQWSSYSSINRTIIHTSNRNLTDAYNQHKNSIMPREGAISNARNIGVEYMRQLPRQTEYVIVIDMDLLGLSEVGVADSMGRAGVDVICSHGVILHGIYRDTYAFRTKELNTNHHWGDDQNKGVSDATRKALKKASHQAKLGVYALADAMSSQRMAVPVESCFGGLAIYRTELFGGCSYSHRYDVPPFMLDCEHVVLHKCMGDKHRAKIVSNPNMRLWYGAHSLNIKYRDVFG